MATKPTTTPRPWATNAVYTTGPFIGQPGKVAPSVGVAAEGHRPGAANPTAAEHENYQQNRITAWIDDWVFLGSFAGGANAHIVETGATGRTALQGLDVNNSDAATSGITVVAVNAAGAAVDATQTTGMPVYRANIGNADAIAYLAGLGTGNATAFYTSMTGTTDPGAGLWVQANAATSAPGVRINHAGTGRAQYVLHTGTPPAGSAAVDVQAIGGGVGRAMWLVGKGAIESLRVRANSTAGAVGALIDSLNNTGFALHAQTSALGSAAARAVRAEARANAVGIEATADLGFAVQASASGASGAAIYLPGKATDPTDTFNGRFDRNTTSNTLIHSDQAGTRYVDVWSSRGGLVVGESSDNGVITSNNSLVWTTAATLALTGQDAPHRPGSRIVLRFTCSARTVTAVAGGGTMDLRLLDVDAPATIVTRVGVGSTSGNGYALTANTTAWQSCIVLEFPYDVPLAGDREFVAEFKTATGTFVQIRDAALVPYGAVDAT